LRNEERGREITIGQTSKRWENNRGGRRKGDKGNGDRLYWVLANSNIIGRNI
jgi:hypothetical protein